MAFTTKESYDAFVREFVELRNMFDGRLWTSSRLLDRYIDAQWGVAAEYIWRMSESDIESIVTCSLFNSKGASLGQLRKMRDDGTLVDRRQQFDKDRWNLDHRER